MHLGTQYYRPPFPVQKHWRDDLLKIRDSGLDTLQLWVTWAWVESKPGVYEFGDYDALVQMAADAGLSVILSTIAELQPHWIHEVVAGSEMIDNFGNRVVSSLREESNFGLTPGGCTEHPQVWERMAGFLEQVVCRYRGESHLAGWDIWNELRWHEQSDALVCFCPHCLREYRQWLGLRYGGLDGLNRAWQRRYGNWKEVMPGKLPWRPFTDMMAWQRFVTWKANRHGRRRYELVKQLDPSRKATVHAGDPSVLTAGGAQAYAVDRGNDWCFADDMDGVGCSSFPMLFGMDQTAFSTRIGFAASAAGVGHPLRQRALAGTCCDGGEVGTRKEFWLSEIQGGRGSLGFQQTLPVDAYSQQQWVWRGLAAGADKLLFWCWRDEVFGRESAGFGLNGSDGHAAERLDALRRSRSVLDRYHDILSSYEPDVAEVGVLFSPSSYYLHWSLEGDATVPRNSIEGYCRALTKLSVPYIIIEEEHLEPLTNAPSEINPLRVLFLPRVIVMSDALERALTDFVERGGTLVCESECGAFTAEGIYRSADDRIMARLGIKELEVGRRTLSVDTLEVYTDEKWGRPLSLRARQWLTPLSACPDNNNCVWSQYVGGLLVCEMSLGCGKVIYIGTFLGDAYADNEYRDFELFVKRCVGFRGDGEHGVCVTPVYGNTANAIADEQQLVSGAHNHNFYIRCGKSNGRRVLFVFGPREFASKEIYVDLHCFKGGTVLNLFTNETFEIIDREAGTLVRLPLDMNGILGLVEM